MGRFGQLAFTDSVQQLQARAGSRTAYARMTAGPRVADAIGPDEAEFIAARDSFYIATIGETGWPYIQHRGGPRGFVEIVDAHTIAWDDYRGNKQFISSGNLATNDRAALIFVDYPNRARLKALAHVRVEGGRFIATIEGLDWNCSQHITPRFAADEL